MVLRSKSKYFTIAGITVIFGHFLVNQVTKMYNNDNNNDNSTNNVVKFIE